MKKFVFFDTNSPIDRAAEIYHIHESEIMAHKLAEGDHVTAYMDNEEWDARIVRQGDKWGVVLLSEAREISSERYEGQQEGLSHGMHLQRQRALRVLEDLGLSDALIEEARRRMMLL